MGHDILLGSAAVCELIATITGFAGKEPYWRGLMSFGIFLFILSTLKL